MAFQWSAVPKDVAGPESLDDAALEAELTLRAQLAKLSVTELQQKAFIEGVDATAVADASLDNEDESDKRRALIKLLVRHASAARSNVEARDDITAGRTATSTRRRRRARVPERPKGQLEFGRMSAEATRLPRVPASRLETSLQRLS